MPPPTAPNCSGCHPEFAAELAAFFAEQDRLHALAAPLRDAVGPDDDPTAADPDATAAAPPPDSPPTAHGDDPSDPADPGESVRYFGDYELIGEIARGGMGVVYRARQLSLNRPVALKMILAGRLAAEADLARFRNEAEAVAQLDHPHIVPIYEVGEHRGYQLLQHEARRGRRPRRPPRPTSPATPAPRPGCWPRSPGPSTTPTSRGVLHRDLKPSNILLDADGQPARHRLRPGQAVEADSDLTADRRPCWARPRYMAPEQAAGQRRAITVATDVYGLGAILYALLTGRPPFRGDSVAGDARAGPRPSPRPAAAAHPGLDRDLETICLKCLEKDPARRYASAEALADDLDRWLDGRPILARPGRAGSSGPGGGAGATRWSRPCSSRSSCCSAHRRSARRSPSRRSARLEAELRQRQRSAANFRAALDAVDAMTEAVGAARISPGRRRWSRCGRRCWRRRRPSTRG